MPRNFRQNGAPRPLRGRSWAVARRPQIEWLLFKLESHLNKNGYKLEHTVAGIKILPIPLSRPRRPVSWYSPLPKSDPGPSSRTDAHDW